MRRWIPVALMCIAAIAGGPLALAQRAGTPVKGAAVPVTPAKPAKDDPRVAKLKQEAVADVESMRELTQQMVDSVFSFAELGFQEFETHRYIVGILKKNGFTVQEGIAGIPTAFM